MGYVLLASLLVAIGWGFKSATSISHPDLLTVALSSAVVMAGSLFWVVVTVHVLDLIVAWRRSDRDYLVAFASSLRPRLLEFLIAMPLVGMALWITYLSAGTTSMVFVALGGPFYLFSIATVLSARSSQGQAFPMQRTRLVLSLIYIAMFVVTTYLASAVTTKTVLSGAIPWLCVTAALVALASYLSATRFRSSVEQGRALTSHVLGVMGGVSSDTRSQHPKSDMFPGRNQKSLSKKQHPHFPSQHRAHKRSRKGG